MLRVWQLFFALVFSVMPLQVAALDQPTGPVVLTVTGNISATNGENAALFDREMLEQLDWQEIRTFTSFTKGEQVFAGPTLASLLQALGVEDGAPLAAAINDYKVSIDVADAGEHDVLLAMDRNGRPMRVREKGPIWIVYPMSETDGAQNKFNAEMIWQLVSIHVQ
jgi:hypothetical protein